MRYVSSSTKYGKSTFVWVFFVCILSLFPVRTDAAEKEALFLNQKEKAWIKERKEPLRIGVTQIPNQVLLSDKGGYRGFSIDLFHLIEKRLGIRFIYIYFETWQALMEAAKERKIDIVFSAQKTPRRLAYLDFTDTVLTQQNKILVNMENDTYSSMDTMVSPRIAVTAGSAIEEFLQYNYPNIKRVPVKTELDALKLLDQKEVDAAISESVRASYYIEKYNLNNLRIADDLGYDYHLSIASQRDLPMLSVVLSKSVANIPKRKLDALLLKWGYIKDKVIFFDKQVLIYLAIAFGIIIPFLIYLYFINRKLEQEVTVRKQTMEKLVKMRKFRLTQMSEVMGMIAHQWKQPLNHLALIHMQLLIKYRTGKLDDTVVEDFHKSTQRQIMLMSNTIDDFRYFFKVEEEKRVFDVGETIGNVLDITKSLFEQEGITIVFHHGKEQAYPVYGYANALLQVLLNVMNNAKDALLETEHMKKRIEIILNEQDGYVVVHIKDNAGGIPEEIIDRIFNPYFSTKEKKNGTGLGLYMSKVILEEQMEGSINVRNEGQGADFEIRLKKA